MLWMVAEQKVGLKGLWAENTAARTRPDTTCRELRMAYLCVIMDPRATGYLKFILHISLPPIDKGETCFTILLSLIHI